MLVYLLKFSACLAIFLVFYKLFLERESMHHLKRYFLLATLILALGIPLITFIQYVEPLTTNTVSPSLENFQTFSEITNVPVEVDYTPLILWNIYGFGVLLFGIKFFWNISNILYKIQHNPKQKSQSFIHVLLNDLVIPHTFFSYIFLNKQKFETKEIPQEVFWHEQAHAKQKHSLDVLFIELLQVVFWFNPLIYLAKHAIKLNHEFLADQAVLNQGVQPSAYQQILLAFSSNADHFQLANAINYSSIKKRFTVMKTHTSKQNIWLRSLLLLPLVAVTLYGFSETRVVERPIKNQVDGSFQNIQEEKSQPQTVTLKDKYYENATVQFRDKDKNIIRSKKYFELSEVEKEHLPNPPKNPKKRIPTQKQLDDWKDPKTYGVWIDNSRIENNKLNSVKTSDFDLYYVSKLEKNAVNYGKHFYQVSVYTKEKYNALYKDGVNPLSETAIISIYMNLNQQKATPEEVEWYNNLIKDVNSKTESQRIFKQKDVNSLEDIYNRMSQEQKANAEHFPKLIDFSKQQKATPEEIAEYNKLAKQCNSELSKQHPIIKVKEVERVEYLYSKMSHDQKKNSGSYPDFSKVPPPPSPETGFIKVNGETLFYLKFNPTKYYNKKGYLVDKNGKLLNGNNQVNASNVLPGQYITKIYRNDKVVVEFKDTMQKQQKATPEEVAEYNKLAKHFNSQPPNKTIIKQKDAERMKYLYDKMSKEQKANAEPLPNMVPPPPPPVPDAPK